MIVEEGILAHSLLQCFALASRGRMSLSLRVNVFLWPFVLYLYENGFNG